MQEVRPQAGFQMQFLSSTADIVIGGAAAGVGKSWCLLSSPLRHRQVDRFNTVTFRREATQIRNPGGLWDKSDEMYPQFGFKPNDQQLEWYLHKHKITLKFAHLQYEKDIYSHDGAEYALVQFDELQHFTRKQFIYLLSRNRSTCGVRPYLLAGCNPDPDSFLATMLEWWIDQNEKVPECHTEIKIDKNGDLVEVEVRNKNHGERNSHWGFPIQERVGIVRYMISFEDKFIWGNSKEEIIKKYPEIFSETVMYGVEDPKELIKSVTLITGKIKDNQALLKTNPGYLANLFAQDEVERLRLLEGNWKVRGKNNSIFNQFSIENLFTNVWPSETTNRYITCDAARFGPDLCTIFVWMGWKVAKLIVLSKSDEMEIVENIERERERYSIIKGHVIVDQDGLGGGVVKRGKYIGFSGHVEPLEDPGTSIKEAYFNRKTQFYYRFAEKVNEDSVSIPLDQNNVMIDGVYSTKIKIDGVVHDVRDLIKSDLKAIRKKDADKDGKKKINGKDEQKALLGDRSPDFADGMMLRVWFDFRGGKIKGAVAVPTNRKSRLDYVYRIPKEQKVA